MSHGGHLSSKKQSSSSQWKTIKTLAPYLWVEGRLDLKTRVVLAIACIVLAKVIGVYVPFMLKDAIDQLNSEPNTLTIAMAVPTGLIIGYGIARIVSYGFTQLRVILFAKISQNAVRQFALKTFKHLHNLSMAYHLKRKTGGLTRIVERGTKGIEYLLHYMLFNIFPTILEISLITGVFWLTFGVLYAVICLVCMIAYIVFTLRVTEWRTAIRRAMNEHDTKANTHAVDSLLNFETVKYFTNEQHELTRYDSAFEKYEKSAIRSELSLSFLNIGQNVIISTGLVIILWMAAKATVAGELTIGQFVLVNSLLLQIYMPLNFLGGVYRAIKQYLIDMENMFQVLEENPDIVDADTATKLDIHNGDIIFDKVCFGYDSSREILKDISFAVKAGTTTAIVGASGAGKSTISRLLFRFYDVTSGAVTIDGQNIQDVQQLSLRDQIGVVPQDTVLFNDSIQYNIAYGRPDATKQEIIEAAKLAHIHDFIASLPEGYDAQVGERGLKLSGGEKQRVAIARTILKNPPILLLDEATSALDSKTEQDIQKALEHISQNRTTLVIAHRLSTVVHANEILVMDNGEIIERGTHTELLNHDSVYKSMWNKQKQGQNS